MIMGRKTFESIGRPLPGRRNIVITRDENYQAEGIETVTSLEEALALAGDVPEVMIIGGEQIFRLVMEMADRLYITKLITPFREILISRAMSRILFKSLQKRLKQRQKAIHFNIKFLNVINEKAIAHCEGSDCFYYR